VAGEDGIVFEYVAEGVEVARTFRVVPEAPPSSREV